MTRYQTVRPRAPGLAGALLVLAAAIPGPAPAIAQPPAVSGASPGAASAGGSPAASGPVAGTGGQAFAGGVTEGEASGTVLHLSLDQAIARGLRNNLGLLLTQAGEGLALGERWQSLAALLPAISGRVSEDREKLNLAAFGLPVAPGESPLVGPFDIFDTHLALEQKLIDVPARERLKASRAGLDAARADARNARDLVVLVVTRLYLGVVGDRARLAAADAELETAQALDQLARDQLRAGTVAKIEVLRAQVELETRQQQKIVNANDLAKDKLALARAIGLPLAQVFELSDEIPYATAPVMSVDQALATARSRRADLAAARARLAAARSELAAARGARLPSLGLRAQWGTIGPTPSASLTSYDLGVALGIPLFLGGRVHGEVLAAQARVKEAEDRLSDTEAQVEYEIRGALLDLDAADHRVTTATTARDLAHQQLDEARDRFRAGVSGNLEVVQAQQAVAAAHESYIASLYAYNLAKVSLARALGVAEEQTAEFLKGNR
jgi:outer membrane protein TolC